MRIITLTIVFFMLSLNQLTHAVAQAFDEVQYKIGNRSLIILLDMAASDSGATSGTPLGITTADLYALLRHHKKTIIIASRNLWENIISCYNRRCAQDIQALDISHWHVYTSKNEALLIFIPKKEPFSSYLNKLNTFTASDTKNNISDGELLLGIKVSRLQKIENPMTLQPSFRPSLSDNMKLYLQEILVNYADTGLKSEGRYLNYWDVYLAGHGTSSTQESGILNLVRAGAGSIASLSIDSFSKFLDFLNKNIKTRSLLYNTCYAGSNLKAAYQYQNNNVLLDKELNFVAIATTAFDLPVPATVNTNTGESLQAAAIFSYFDSLHAYFHHQNKSSLYSFSTTIQDLARHMGEGLAPAIAIRYPRSGKFRIDERFSLIFALNNSRIIRAINGNKTAITIPHQAWSMTLIARYVPVTLVLPKNELIMFYPFISNNTSYFFKEIDASQSHISLVGQAAQFKTTIPSASSNFVDMLSALRKEVPHVGKFYIETLKIAVPYQKTANGTLNWGNHPLLFKDVIMDPGNFISLNYNDTPFTYSFKDNYWTQGYKSSWIPLGSLHSDFVRAKSAILQESELPASMKAEIPKPMIDLPLWYGYLQRKQNQKTLNTWQAELPQDQKNRFERLQTLQK